MPPSGRRTSVLGRSGPADVAATKAGRICGAAVVSGPGTPVVSHQPAASSGADAVAARPAIRVSVRHRGRPSDGRSRPAARHTASITGTAASSRPAAAMAIATPGQALTAGPPCGGVTRIRLTTRATTSPASAMPQPEYTRAVRLRSSSAQNAGSTRPAVTHTGGSPGPPGLSSSSEAGRSPAAAIPGPASPASSRKADGRANRSKVQGTRTTPGTTATITALDAVAGGSQRHAASAASAATTAIAQINGTNAAATAISRAAAQAALRVVNRDGTVEDGPVRTRPRAMPMSGSRTKATAVPILPAATAPMATGSSA